MRGDGTMRLWFVLSVLSVVVSLTSCGGGDAPPSEPGSRAAPSPAIEATWLAAVEVAPRADDLDAATERLKGPLGTALVVSPTDCFDGLPPEAGDGYVIGAVGRSEEHVAELVTDAGETVLFTASVTVLCTD